MRCCGCGVKFECDAKFKSCETKMCFCKKCWEKTRTYKENPQSFRDCYNIHITPEKVQFD